MKKLLSLLCVIVSLTLFALTGCSNNDTFTAKSYSSGESVVESVSMDVSDRQISVFLLTYKSCCFVHEYGQDCVVSLFRILRLFRLERLAVTWHTHRAIPS